MNPRERVPTSAAQMGSSPTQRKVGRYTFYGLIASGGMASVYFGRLSGQVGFSKTVAIKRPHPHLLDNPEFVNMFVDEARLAARIQHPNVVATLDVVATEEELFLVMDYVHGDSFSHLLAAAASKGVFVPVAIVGSVMVNVLHGLHAAHDAVDEHGNLLGIVHRDVSPQNVMIGVDGVARVLDFGVAKAAGRLQSTSQGQLKGKLAYMAPEQVQGAAIDRRTDVYAAAALMWGALAGRRLIDGNNEAESLNFVLQGNHVPPSVHAPHVPAQLDAIVMRGLSKDPNQRFSTAREMAIAIESALGVVSPYQVGEWVKSLAADSLELRSKRVREMESSEVSISLHDGSVAAVRHKTPDGPPSVHERGLHFSRTPPPYSATSSSHIVAPEEQEPPERSLAAYIGIAALAFVLTVGAVLAWLYGRSSSDRADTLEPPPPTLPAPKAAAQPAPPVTAVPAAQPAPVVELDDARDHAQAGSAKPDSSPVSKSAPPAKLVKPATVASAAATSASAPSAAAAPPPPPVKKKVDCDSSPFFIDQNGIKRVRPECS